VVEDVRVADAVSVVSSPSRREALDVRGSGSTPVFPRTLLCLAVVVALGAVAAGSAGAVTITSWLGGKGATPAIVTAGGTWCPPTMTTINGTGFVSDGGVPSVSIGGVPASEVIVGSDVIMYARVGTGAKDGGSVVVTTPRGSVTAALAVDVVPCQSTGIAEGKPTISTITSKAKAGKKITVHGTGFVGTTLVKVGGVKQTNYAIPSDQILYVNMPADAKAGLVTVEITNTHGTVKGSVVKTG